MKNTLKTLMIMGAMLQGTAVLAVCNTTKEATANTVYASCITGCKDRAKTDALRMECIESKCDPAWRLSMQGAGCPSGTTQLKQLKATHK